MKFYVKGDTSLHIYMIIITIIADVLLIYFGIKDNAFINQSDVEELCDLRYE